MADGSGVGGVVLAVLVMFAGCCSTVVFLELMVTLEPQSGNLITFSQFLFISLEGFVFTSRLGTKANVIPIREYLVIVVMFFLVNLSNNLAFSYKIAMPLHIIFRSGGLIANLIMGKLVLGHQYSLTKYVSVAMITAGTLLATLASAQVKEESDAGTDPSDLSGYVIGIILLTVALFMSARMGIYQECLYNKHGRHTREALFYIHSLSLMGFLVTWRSIVTQAVVFWSSTPLTIIPGIPKLFLYLAANTITQYVCISSVFWLTSRCSSLTVTLVLTLRKLASLVFSVIYLGNPFTSIHWAGTLLVFGGTVLFSDLPKRARERWRKRAKVD